MGRAPARERNEAAETRKRGRSGDGGEPQNPANKRGRRVAAPASRRRERSGGIAPPKVPAKGKTRCMSSCTSPRPMATCFLSLHFTFNWYETDMWTEVAKYLDGKSLVSLSLVSRWFRHLILDESIWRYAFLRDLQVPLPSHTSPFKWSQLYASAFDGSHSYLFRQREKHIDWMRIGAFFFESPTAVLTETLPTRRKLQNRGLSPDKSVRNSGAFVLPNVRTGIWIADLQLVRCPVCNLNSCEGTMQVLDARHAELYHEEGYRNGSWDYVEVAEHRIEKHTRSATGGIFDLAYIDSPCTAEVLNVKSWMGQPEDWQPKARVCLHAVAVNTNLQANEGIHVRFHVMRGADGEVVSMRVSQQLV